MKRARMWTIGAAACCAMLAIACSDEQTTPIGPSPMAPPAVGLTPTSSGPSDRARGAGIQSGIKQVQGGPDLERDPRDYASEIAHAKTMSARWVFGAAWEPANLELVGTRQVSNGWETHLDWDEPELELMGNENATISRYHISFRRLNERGGASNDDPIRDTTASGAITEKKVVVSEARYVIEVWAENAAGPGLTAKMTSQIPQTITLPEAPRELEVQTSGIGSLMDWNGVSLLHQPLLVIVREAPGAAIDKYRLQYWPEGAKRGNVREYIAADIGTARKLINVPEGRWTITAAAHNRAGWGTARIVRRDVNFRSHASIAPPGKPTEIGTWTLGSSQRGITWIPPADVGGLPIRRYLYGVADTCGVRPTGELQIPDQQLYNPRSSYQTFFTYPRTALGKVWVIAVNSRGESSCGTPN